MASTMKAIRVKRFGGPDAVALEEVPRPRPGAGEVLVRVEAASINPLDWKLREVLFETTLWGTIKELREVVALVENGRIDLNPCEAAPLERANEIYARLKRGEVEGRVILTP